MLFARTCAASETEWIKWNKTRSWPPGSWVPVRVLGSVRWCESIRGLGLHTYVLVLTVQEDSITWTPSSLVPRGGKGCFVSHSHSAFLWVEPWAFLGLEGFHSLALVSSTRNWRWQERFDPGGWDAVIYQISSPLFIQSPCQIVPGDAGSQPSSGPYFCSPCYQRAWGSGSYLAPSG